MNNNIKFTLFILSILLFISSCKNSTAQEINTKHSSTAKVTTTINSKNNTIETRFNLPINCQRTLTPENSFQSYLRNLPLKKDGTLVKFYYGDFKPNNQVYHAVVDLPIGNKDLHQCADAIMRLRSEYLWKNKQYDKIHFNFTNGFRVDYSEWMKGRRMVVKGNKTYWNNRNNPSNTYEDWWNYMELIFNYAGTASLEKELKKVSPGDMQIGDIFIIGGFPGHAVIVVDMCENTQTKQKYFMLAQSYMPAQEIQILQNPANSTNSPWYTLENGGAFETPEWNFDYVHLKRFEE